MTDELDAEGIARKQFSSAFRGFDQYEVRAFLGQVATTLATLREREKALRERIDASEARSTASSAEEFDLEAALGAETTKVLHAAREAATEIRSHAEESVARMLREASDEATTMRAEAEAILAKRTEEADAEASAIIAAAEARGREMVSEAQAVRERMLKDLARKRKVAAVQLEQLLAARQRLLDAYDVVRQNLDSVTDELAVAEEQARLAADVAGLKAPPDEPLDITTAPVAEEGPVAADAAPAVSTPPAQSPDEPPAPPTIVIVDDEHADQPQGSATAADDRRSSSLRLLRPAAEPAGRGEQVAPTDDEIEGVRLLRPDATPAPRPVALVPDEGAVEADRPAADAVGEPVADEPVAADDAHHEAPPAEDLFARLRADRAAALEHAEAVLAEPDTAVATDEPPAEESPAEPIERLDPAAPVPDVVGSPADRAFEARDAALEPVERALVKALKRALADEQNEVLDTLRRAKRTPSLDDLMPGAGEHGERFAALASEHVAAGFEAGAASVGGSAPLDGDLAPHFGAEVADDLRSRVGRVLDATGSDDEALVEAISATYREWKTARTEPLVRHHLAAAYALGAFAASGEGPLRWLVDTAEGACPDCDDNALAGPTPKGERYPTGQPHPPAHNGCRCLVLPEAQ
jgi:DivIVA domain-containing protein